MLFFLSLMRSKVWFLCIIDTYVYYPLVKRQDQWWSRMGPWQYIVRIGAQNTTSNSKDHLKIFQIFLASTHGQSFILALPSLHWRIVHLSILDKRISMYVCYSVDQYLCVCVCVCVCIKASLCMHLYIFMHAFIIC
jgi:hypothetical protein